MSGLQSSPDSEFGVHVVGPPAATQLCPNPYCRQPFDAINGLHALLSHFSNTTPCGHWIQIISQVGQHLGNVKACPNPSCRQVFETADELIQHVCAASTPCYLWFRNQPAGPGNDPSLEDVDMDSGEPLEDEDEESRSNASGEDEGDDISTNVEMLQESPKSQPHFGPPSTQDMDVQPPSDELPEECLRQANVPPGVVPDFHHHNRPISKKGGSNLVQWMDQDVHAEKRAKEPYYPFASKAEWQLGAWLASGKLSHADINEFLHTDFIRQHPLSFKTARMLMQYVASLPSIPQWHYQELKVPNYETKEKIVLYYRDGLDVVHHLFRNPIFASCMEMTPYRAIDKETQRRVYGKYMSGDEAWQRANKIDPEASILGIIGASDKTSVTIGSGGSSKQMHPLLLSIANIQASVRMKASSHAYALAAYIPIPKFKKVSKKTQSMLSARVYHAAVSIVTARLQGADTQREGVILHNPWGGYSRVHTPLVAWIADYPEQLLIAGIAQGNSASANASHDQLGDPTMHPLRERKDILKAIRDACVAADPGHPPLFSRACKKLQLNGVLLPFWEKWGEANPSKFLTTDALHQHHKFFFDHCVQWAKNIMGAEELDRRLAVLPPMVGVRSWPDGVSTLKRLTGRDHRALERIFVVVIAGAVNNQVLRAICAIVDFIFLAQNLYHYPETLSALDRALQEFHDNKKAIIDSGGRRGKSGAIINHFKLPKLESMLHVTRLIRLKGAAFQYTSDITERCHITLVKRPYRLSNRVNYHEQCCRFLDREEKIRLFHLYTSVKMQALATTTAMGTSTSSELIISNQVLLDEMKNEAAIMDRQQPEHVWVSHRLPDENLLASSRSRGSKPLASRSTARISSDMVTHFLVTQQPQYVKIPFETAARFFNLPDLQPALIDYYQHLTYSKRNGQRSPPSDFSLPFTHINVWKSLRIQSQATQDSRLMAPIQTIQALHPAPDLPLGRYSTAIVREANLDYDDCSIDDQLQIPEDMLENSRIQIVQVRIIFQPVITAPGASEQPILFYGQRFSIKPAQTQPGGTVGTQPNIDMYLLERQTRPDKTYMGDIFTAADLRRRVHLAPHFGGERVPEELTADESLTFYNTFYLNNYDEKETFHAILTY